MKCPHCNTELEGLPEEKGRKNVYRCPKCKCVFGLTLIKFDGKCYEKMFPEVIRELKRITKDKKVERPKGRPRKNGAD
jgi:tRNA(Ile2) C34 agmatinyltransferase TiaS